jgi:hypothetical protein
MWPPSGPPIWFWPSSAIFDEAQAVLTAICRPARGLDRASLGATDACAKLARMRRWLLVFLLIFVPLQLTWAAATVHCQRVDRGENTASDYAAGTISHAHASTHPDHECPPSAQTLGLDDDCGVCHANCSLALPAPLAIAHLDASGMQIQNDLLFPTSHYLDLPDRPQWAALA